MAELKALFKLSPALAIKYFRNKKNKQTWDWYELWQSAYQKTFTVAKAVKSHVLEDIREALDKALSEGKTFHDFQKELKPILQHFINGVSKFFNCSSSAVIITFFVCLEQEDIFILSLYVFKAQFASTHC